MSAARRDPARRIELDHLVVAARTLEEGVAWSEATLGVVPAPGGRHAMMGTHNCLLDMSSARHPSCFLEIIAIDPSAPAPQRARWFDLDAPALQRALASGPRLVHWVARTGDVFASAAQLRAFGHEPGTPTMVERMTPRGMLRWRMTLRDDGCRPAGGALPLLIEWAGEHPCDALAPSGLSIERLELGGVSVALAALVGAEAGDAVAGRLDVAPLKAILTTPKGRIELVSPRTLGA